MDKRLVLARLREVALELKAVGIVHFRLHGSVVRGQETRASDVDLIAEFNADRRFSLPDMVNQQDRLEDLLGVPVDLSTARALKEPVRQKAAREAVLVF